MPWHVVRLAQADGDGLMWTRKSFSLAEVRRLDPPLIARSHLTRRINLGLSGPYRAVRAGICAVVGANTRDGRRTGMLPVSLIFTSGVASGVNSYAAVLVLGLLGRFGHIAAIPPVLERPSVLAAAAVLYIGQFVVGKIPMLDSVWDVAHTALRPVVGGAVGVAMAQHAQASSAATIAAALLGGGAALASHLVKTGMRVGVNTSPEPFSNIAASLLEDLGVAGLVLFAVFRPVAAATVAAVVLALGIALFALLASRIRRGWHRRRGARLRPRPEPSRRSPGTTSTTVAVARTSGSRSGVPARPRRAAHSPARRRERRGGGRKDDPAGPGARPSARRGRRECRSQASGSCQG
jgi:Domain of unknown function (DUF4126)